MANYYEKISNYHASRRMRDFRTYMQNRYGKNKYKITNDGAVYAFGKMPNTNVQGWHLFGHYPACAIENVG